MQVVSAKKGKLGHKFALDYLDSLGWNLGRDTNVPLIKCFRVGYKNNIQIAKMNLRFLNGNSKLTHLSSQILKCHFSPSKQLCFEYATSLSYFSY
jgi:hypothetical protein